MKRYAVVHGLSVTTERVAAYLPRNYRVCWSGRFDMVEGITDDVVVIEGEDFRGWTLDGYVAPRLGSGLMRCGEVDLSHPIMKKVPV